MHRVRESPMMALIALSTFLVLFVVHASAEKVNENGSPPIWSDPIDFVLHRNGEPSKCGSASIPSITNLLNEYDIDSNSMNKYDVETFLTRAFAENIDNAASCGSVDNHTAPEGILSFCDMGVDRTPILLDHDRLVRLPGGSLPCRWYTREGLRIKSLGQLEEMAAAAWSKNMQQQCESSDTDQQCVQANGSEGKSSVQLHLYGVPAGRVFMFAPEYVGEIFDLSHLTLNPFKDNPIYLKVLSTNPRVFDVVNFFTGEEADEIVKRALEETSPSHKMHRSTTGTTEYSIFNKRTSSNAFDTHGLTAIKLKKRCFEALGFDQYWNGHDDGLQVLRYNLTEAYIQHMDYLTDRSGMELYNYDSAGKGGNRFATILLYMTDIPENSGGQTVFSEVYDPQVPINEIVRKDQALTELRDSGAAAAAGIKSGSWEEDMLAMCGSSKLTVTPSRGRSVLFYSQLPNGQPDPMSKHGSCPLIRGEKWAANLWVWNTPRGDFPGQPLREDLLAQGIKPSKKQGPPQLQASFQNSGRDPALKDADLYYDEGLHWGKLGHGDPPLNVNTYEGHRWNLRVDGKIVKEWVIDGREFQTYTV